MSLRARMGIAAGVAVALAVLAVTVSAYEGTRSELLGQLDNSLQTLAAKVLPPPGAPLRRGGPGDHDGGLGLERTPQGAFGGPSGTFQVVHPDGTIFLPPGEQSRIPVDAAVTATAASGRGEYFTSLT